MYREIADSVLSLQGFRVVQISLTSLAAPALTTIGGSVNYAMPLSPYLTANAAVGYRNTDVTKGDDYDAEVGLTYLMAENMSARLKYDFVRHASSALHATNYDQNAVTLTVRASF